MSVVLWVVGAYLLGSISAAYVIPRLIAGVDVRQQGSGNLGATNVYRALGLRYAMPVALFDVAKGAVPVFVARLVAPEPWMPLLVGVAAVVGHVFSVFLRFRGGKGVATAAGVVLGIAPLALAGSGVVWGLAVASTGYVSLASILGALSFTLWARLFYPSDHYTFWLGLAMGGFILFTHRSNIRRLLAGTESRFGRRGQTEASS